MNLPAYVYRSDVGDYVATLPDVPNSFARGDTIDEAVDDLRAWLLAR